MKRARANIDQEVAAIGDLSRDELARLWEKSHGSAPPKGIRQELLARSATWQLQARRIGGFSTDTRRLLNHAIAEMERADRLRRKDDRIVDRDNRSLMTPVVVGGAASRLDATATNGSKPPPIRRRVLQSGARLVREWNGKVHVVDVIEDGFVFEAKVHGSLTAIAHQITGAHWSGPRFFGL